MRFTKMHGCGNDYLLLDEPVEVSGDAVRGVCERRTGIGADGVIVMRPSTTGGADVEMTIFNSDGGDGGVCGNGARCVAVRAAGLGWAGGTVRIAVGGRVLVAELLDDGFVRIDMGEPVLDLAEIPVDAGGLEEVGTLGVEHQVAGLPAVFVSMGNPHMVAMVEEEFVSFDLPTIGERIEHHRAFPEGMNLHLARVRDAKLVSVLTWERGAGATLACGTGACAVVVAGVLTGRLEREAVVEMPGGELLVRWDDAGGRVLLTGPTAVVGECEWAAADRVVG